MDALAAGLVTLLNGLFKAIGALASPVVIATVLAAAALAWLAVIEIEELNRQGTKPGIGRH